MTGKEFAMKYGEFEFKEFAKNISETITIRTYDNGNSVDTKRNTTNPEKEIIRNIAYGAMLGYRFIKSDVHGILETAELILRQFIPECNTYDTIYIPLCNIMETWY